MTRILALLLLISPAGQPEATRAWITAELLTLDAMRIEAEGDDRAAHAIYAKALLLYNALDPATIGGLPEAGDRIAQLRAKLIDLEPDED